MGPIYSAVPVNGGMANVLFREANDEEDEDEETDNEEEDDEK
jgi:hypothetical protein